MPDASRFIWQPDDVVTHVSAVERSTDSGFEKVDVTPVLAMKVAGVDLLAPREEQLEDLQEAVNEGVLNDAAVRVLLPLFPELA